MRDEIFSGILVALVLMLCGCTDNAGATQKVGEARLPDSEELRKITAPDYVPPAKALRECLGRIAFEIPDSVQWPTSKAFGYLEKMNHTFSSNLFDQGDVIKIDGFQIGVMYPLTGDVKNSIVESLPDHQLLKKNKDLKESELRLRELQRSGDSSARGRNRVRVEELHIRSLNNSISKLQFNKISTGLSNVYAYSARQPGDNGEFEIWAYVFNENAGYSVISTVETDEKFDSAAHEKKFLNFVRSLQPRKIGFIPKDLGICIPFGFFKDDGKTAYDIKMSMRYPDAPGVLYTLHTGNVEERTLKTTLLNAVVAASVGMPVLNERTDIAKYVTNRIGPKPVKIGGVIGEQGGVALHVRPPGGVSFEAYNVYSGYSGWLGTMALPYMIVELRSFTMAQAPELKSNPPPFNQSKERLDFLLQGMRLRETTPKMPELR